MSWEESREPLRTPGNPFGDLFMSDEPATGDRPIRLLNDEIAIHEIMFGGMGEVLICRYTNEPNAMPLALKSFQKQFFFQPQARDAFEREVLLWSTLSGLPHIMPVFGTTVGDDRTWVMMMAVPRGPGGIRTVRDVINHVELDEAGIAILAAQIALGMHLAEERVPNLVHGDLKPENLLMMGSLVIISDFGLARIAGGKGQQVTGGTPAYLAPEVWADPTTASQASDVFAFGMVLFELMIGERPPGPPIPRSLDPQDLSEMLILLACACLAPDPSARPSFRDIYLAILDMAGRTMPGLSESAMSLTLIMTTEMEALAIGHFEIRLGNLYRLGRDHDIIAAVEAATPEIVSPDSLVIAGDALARLERNDEAIAMFDRVLDMNPYPETRMNAISGKGLSFKQMGRFAEAQELLRQVVLQQTPSRRPGALMNLATAHLEEGDYEHALDLLQHAAQLRDDVWQIWMNMGQVHEGLRDYPAAAAAYQKAVSLMPSRREPLMALAAVCMDHLGWMPIAQSALRQLQDQGFTDRPWRSRLVAFNRAVGHDSSELLDSIREQLGEEEVARTEAAAARLLKRVDWMPAPKPEPVRAEPEDHLQLITNDTDLSGHSAYSAARGGAPILGVRLYALQKSHSWDFFCAPDNPSYVDLLWSALQEMERLTSVAGMRTQPRDVAPYFHRCRSCDVHVLTTRHRGAPLRCRGCAAVSPTQPVRSAELDDLVERVAARMGSHLIDISGFLQTVIVHLASAEHANAVRIIAGRLGFEPMPSDAPTAAYLLTLARGGSMLDFGKHLLVALSKHAAADTWVVANGGTPEVDRLTSTLRAVLPVLNSASLYFDPQRQDMMATMLSGDREAHLANARQLAAAQPDNPDVHHYLAWLAAQEGLIDEADNLARIGIGRWKDNPGSWTALGHVRLSANDFAGARAALETSLRLNPVQPQVLLLLARCAYELGDEPSAQSYAARAASLGGELM
jgi:serine/threonine protein kinase